MPALIFIVWKSLKNLEKLEFPTKNLVKAETNLEKLEKQCFFMSFCYIVWKTRSGNWHACVHFLPWKVWDQSVTWPWGLDLSLVAKFPYPDLWNPVWRKSSWVSVKGNRQGHPWVHSLLNISYKLKEVGRSKEDL